ncbi:hypothetical protein [Actinomadura mexicana]|uniref:Aminoacyl-transfer RNA synthetases class-II family profile domain-containing protein n=1 Tax=Actinomadura mexicana TaxID=134959 RepID=A0A238VMT4_9ACTN|nr:hypothetical protein [Actinomadura mexicana]SNR35546.1 hypothetical protein SAMN06265355_10280 [Actinomadura mexicana]
MSEPASGHGRPGPGTTEHTVPLPRPVPAELATELARRIFFVSEDIVGFRLLHGQDEAVDAVVLRTGAAEPAAALSRKLRQMVRTDVLGQLARPAKVIWRSTRTADTRPGVFGALADRGAAFETGEGQVAVGEPILTIMDRFDGLLRDIAVTEFGAAEFRYPTLVPTGALQRSGYFSAFPQHVMLATRLQGDLDVYRKFTERDHDDGNVGEAMLAHCRNADYCLPPTMCYHTFHQYAGKRLPSSAMVVSARGKSFRYEGRYHASLERLWDFTIREIVFMGERDQVLDRRERFLQRAIELVDRFGLRGRCEVATDPFFGAVDGAERISAQRLLELKYELRLDIAPDATVAVGSFNFHEQHFGKAFDITGRDGGPIWTGCVGFGLERLAYAFVCQHGLDESDWPEGLHGGESGRPHGRGIDR